MPGIAVGVVVDDITGHGEFQVAANVGSARLGHVAPIELDG